LINFGGQGRALKMALPGPRPLLLLLLLPLFLALVGGEVHGQDLQHGAVPSAHVSFEVKRSVRHDAECFTQGLQLYRDVLYESCGLNGRSSVRKVDPATGNVLVQTKLPDVFAEGLTVMNGKVYVLTWKNKKLFVLDAETLQLEVTTTFQTFNGEGWGLTHDGRDALIASDGSDRLTFLTTPKNSATPSANLRTVSVKDKAGNPVHQINELEFVNGFVYANLWYQDVIVKIDPASGQVVERIDLKTLYPMPRAPTADCLNGIAYNSSSNTLILTGKLWPKYYFVQLNLNLEVI
jgi:glutamine cyclotransferase